MDDGFETESAQKADLGYRLWNKGVMLTATKYEVAQLRLLPPPTLNDEYRFIRKYWGASWAGFALMLRLVSLNNPITEIRAYLLTRKVKRVALQSDPIIHEAYQRSQLPIFTETPMVSVIIPTLNRYKWLKDVLHDLEHQAYRNFNVIVVDQSDIFDASFYNKFKLNIQVIRQEEKKLWTARNRAIQASRSEYLLFFDDDSRVAPDWIMQHLKCMYFFGADISAGVSLEKDTANIPESYRHFRWADQFDSGNAMVRRKVFDIIGLFDETFNGWRMGDGEFGFRAYRFGFKSVSNPSASRVHLKVGEGGLREMGHWDAFRSKNWFAPKPLPSAMYLYRKYLPRAYANNAMFIGILLSNTAFKHKKNKNILVLSIVLTIVKAPLLFIQYQRSRLLYKKMAGY